MPLVVVRRDDPAGGLDHVAVAHRAVADVDPARLDLELGRREHRGLPADEPNTSRRRASITGTEPGAPAASASSVETPATGRSSASASPRAAASPIRTPVKLPGPMPTASASRSAGASARLAEQLVGVGEHAHRAGAPLAEHVAVANERRRRDVRRRVKRQGQHRHRATISRRLLVHVA